MAAIDVHVLQDGESPSDFKKLCPTRNQAITTTADHTNLLPNGDGFDWSVYDKNHNAIWFRDRCPIDGYITSFVTRLPNWTATSAASHSDKTGYELVRAIWTDLFQQASQWLELNVSDGTQRSAVTSLLSTIILNWFVSQNYVVMTNIVP